MPADRGTFPRPRPSVPVKLDNSSSADANRKALRKMTPCELTTGKTVEQIDAEMAEQRARVRARYLEEAA